MTIQLDINRRPDPVLSNVETVSPELLKRIVKVAIPFLCFYQPAVKGIAVFSGAIQTYHILSDDQIEGSTKALQVGGLVTSVFLAIYAPGMATALTHGYSAACDVKELFQAAQDSDLETVKEKVAALAFMAFYLTSLYTKRPELIAASLLIQAFKEFKEAYEEYQNENYLECLAKIVLGCFRVNESREHLSKAYRHRFGREFTQKEWDTFVEVVEAKHYGKEVKGGQIDFMRYLEEGNYSDVIQDVNFDGGKGKYFSDYTFQHVQFNNCKLLDADFEDAHLSDVTFISCEMKRSKFYNGVMDDVRFYNSQLQNATFYRTRGKGVSFLGCDLSRACFNGSIFQRLEIVSSRLFGTSFLEAQVADSWIRSCDLTNVLLMDAPFQFEKCSEHCITKPVIALTWDFPDDGSWGAPVEDVIEDHDALCLKFDIYPEDIDIQALDNEVQTKLRSVKDVTLSKAHTILNDGIPTPEIDKIRQRAQRVMQVANGAILSGGEDVEEEFYSDQRFFWGDYRRSMIEYAVIDQRKPIMGICRGSQIINTYYGGTLKDIYPQWGEKELEIQDTRAGEFVRQHIGDKIIGHSAHGQAADRVGKGLDVALMQEGVVKAMFNEDLSVILTQFHPEAYIEPKLILKALQEGREGIFASLFDHLGYGLDEGEIRFPDQVRWFNNNLEMTLEGREALIHLIEGVIQRRIKEDVVTENNKRFFELFMERLRGVA